jgi:hypothetical protein
MLLLTFAVAGCFAVAILFVLYGPVPVRRRVHIVARMAPVAARVVQAPPPREVVIQAPVFATEAATVTTAVEPPIPPLVLRRPRTGVQRSVMRPRPENTPRTRMARGTPDPDRDRPRVSVTDVDITDQITAPVPFFEVEEHTIPDDARPPVRGVRRR